MYSNAYTWDSSLTWDGWDPLRTCLEIQASSKEDAAFVFTK